MKHSWTSQKQMASILSFTLDGIIQVFTKQLQDTSNGYHILLFLILFVEIVGNTEIPQIDIIFLNF